MDSKALPIARIATLYRELVNSATPKCMYIAIIPDNNIYIQCIFPLMFALEIYVYDIQRSESKKIIVKSYLSYLKKEFSRQRFLHAQNV